MGKATYIQTPCIHVCQLNRDNICVGCLRSLDEISAWPDADTDERVRILDNMTERSRKIPRSGFL
jgi:predicted Fe-S protein YdhL (DUF1289 family)